MNPPQYYLPPEALQPPQQDPYVEPQYDRDFDQVERYGSIIKDLTDTEKYLEEYELRLIGKTRDKDGKVIVDPLSKAIIKDEQSARDFIELIRSVANQNTHYSGFDEKDVITSLMALNHTINRWMMFQHEKIPRLYRQKLAIEAMNIAKASLLKANKALILQWSKGNIKEGQNFNYNPNQEKQGMFSWLFPRKN